LPQRCIPRSSPEILAILPKPHDGLYFLVRRGEKGRESPHPQLSSLASSLKLISNPIPAVSRPISHSIHPAKLIAKKAAKMELTDEEISAYVTVREQGENITTTFAKKNIETTEIEDSDTADCVLETSPYSLVVPERREERKRMITKFCPELFAANVFLPLSPLLGKGASSRLMSIVAAMAVLCRQAKKRRSVNTRTLGFRVGSSVFFRSPLLSSPCRSTHMCIEVCTTWSHRRMREMGWKKEERVRRKMANQNSLFSWPSSSRARSLSMIHTHTLSTHTKHTH
jgi:hypothetical protein